MRSNLAVNKLDVPFVGGLLEIDVTGSSDCSICTGALIVPPIFCCGGAF